MIVSIVSPQKLENRFFFKFIHILQNLVSNILHKRVLILACIMETHFVNAYQNVNHIVYPHLIYSFVYILQDLIPQSALLV